jgi:hypothetical protein
MSRHSFIGKEDLALIKNKVPRKNNLTGSQLAIVD